MICSALAQVCSAHWSLICSTEYVRNMYEICIEYEWSVYPKNVRMNLPPTAILAQIRAGSYTRSTRECYEEFADGEGGAEGITWKTVPGSEAWNMYGI